MGETPFGIEQPGVGTMVHLLHGGRCLAALVVQVDEAGTMLRVFVPGAQDATHDTVEPYVSLKSARPTSGWHWPREH